MSTAVKWSGDGLANGAFTTSSFGTGDTPPSSVTGSTLAVATGTPRSPVMAPANGTGTSYATWTIPSELANWGFRFMFRRTAASNAIIASIDDASGAKAASFDFSTSGNLRLSTLASGVNVNAFVSAAVIPADNSWQRVEYREDSAGNWGIRLYAADGYTPSQVATGTKVPQAAKTLRVGRISGAVATTGLQLDDILLLDTADYPGSAVPPPVSPFHIYTATGVVVGARAHRIA